MSSGDMLYLLTTLSISFFGGGLLGLAYFSAVRLTSDLIVTGSKPLLAIALILGRFALMAAGLVLTLQAGAFALLVALAGVLVGRTLAIRWARGSTA